LQGYTDMGKAHICTDTGACVDTELWQQLTVFPLGNITMEVRDSKGATGAVGAAGLPLPTDGRWALSYRGHHIAMLPLPGTFNTNALSPPHWYALASPPAHPVSLQIDNIYVNQTNYNNAIPGEWRCRDVAHDALRWLDRKSNVATTELESPGNAEATSLPAAGLRALFSAACSLLLPIRIASSPSLVPDPSLPLRACSD
jgi:hypothetical protein